MWSLAVQARSFLGQSSGRWTRALHNTPSAWFPDVVVPPLGESVSEGTICAILKKPGDSVQVDETIAQLETDKVTIDCKSQFAGTVSEVLVKTGDVVQPGHKLVVVGEGAPAAASAPAAAPAAPQPAASASASAASSSHARVPSIKFPPRTTADGQRISSLPAAEAAAVLAKLSGTPAAAPAAPKPAAAPKTAAPAGKPATVSGPPRSQDTTYIQERPARRTLLPSEVDIINMGGAWP